MVAQEQKKLLAKPSKSTAISKLCQQLGSAIRSKRSGSSGFTGLFLARVRSFRVFPGFSFTTRLFVFNYFLGSHAQSLRWPSASAKNVSLIRCSTARWADLVELELIDWR